MPIPATACTLQYELGCSHAAAFDISAAEASRMDPQQRMLLQAVWHALENAGIPPTDLAGSATGVFIGMTGTDYADLAMQGGIAVPKRARIGHCLEEVDIQIMKPRGGKMCMLAVARP